MVGEQRRLFGNPGEDDLTPRVLADWIAECQVMGGYWLAKRLSANDTGASDSHQAGLYVPKALAFRIFPELTVSDNNNPESAIRVAAGSHSHERTCRVIWYRQGTRDETRITRWGGMGSPVLDQDNTGAIVLFFFTGEVDSRVCRYWVCRDAQEEDVAESFAGPVEPGPLLFWHADGQLSSEPELDSRAGPCWLEGDQLPDGWLEQFPSTLEVFGKALELEPYSDLRIDDRMLRRRVCEYSVFRSVEHAVITNAIQGGFESVDHFLRTAQSILQRRRSRSGRSLELQVQTILKEENVKHSAQPTVETGNRPDFIFPSQDDYENPNFPAARLRMLACKSTVKERWRQVVGEADRIPVKHLFTLQEGVSAAQYDEMKRRGVRLVVPASLHYRFPEAVRAELVSLQDFVHETRNL